MVGTHNLVRNLWPKVVPQFGATAKWYFRLLQNLPQENESRSNEIYLVNASVRPMAALRI